MAAYFSLDERIELAGKLIVRAKIFYDIWSLYEKSDTRSKLINEMNEYSEFFRFDSHAHFVASIVHLAMLFETRSDTINLRAIVCEMRASATPSPNIDRAEELLARSKELSKKIMKLRNHAFAHRSASLSYKEIFEKASVTPDELCELTDRGLHIVNLLLTARGLPEQVFNPLARWCAEELLSALGREAAT